MLPPLGIIFACSWRFAAQVEGFDQAQAVVSHEASALRGW
jgi:hypothetical protein